MVDRIQEMDEGTRLYLLAPIVRDRKGEYRKEIADLQRMGFARVKIDGTHYPIEDTPALDKNLRHTIEVVVDRLVVRDQLGHRVADSLETALDLTDGIAIAENADTAERTIFSAKFACPVSGFTIDEIEPRLFSFNNPNGACPECDGLGTRMYFDPDRVVPDPSLSLLEGAVTPWSGSVSNYYEQTLAALAKAYDFSLKTAFESLSAKARKVILYGSGNKPVKIIYADKDRSYTINRPFEGVIPNLERRFRETDSSWVREELGKFQTVSNCETCGGARLKPEALAVKIDQRHISEIAALSIGQARQWFAGLNDILTDKQNEIATGILKEINARLGFLVDVGLEYLTLSRTSGTLSGGESQRIRLASQIGSGLTGVLYVLDEPSIGLHQRDNARLLDTLHRLRDIGNTVIVVEHDEEAIRAADWLIDLGPGAGTHGGQVVASGSPAVVERHRKSLTAKYLRGDLAIPIPAERRMINPSRHLQVKGARTNNLKNISVDIPLGVLTCVTGVSGGGKSSLVIETLYKAVSHAINFSTATPGAHDEILGLEHIDKVVDIDQSPIGRTPRSNPATYTGAFTPIRQWFADLPEARARGYQVGRFSFNVAGGRCETCKGDGLIKIGNAFPRRHLCPMRRLRRPAL